jgi:TP901 family phage tail tape measure protein
MAGNIKGITIEIGGDTTKLTSALSKADKAIRETQKGLKDVEKALKLNPGNIQALTEKQQLLRDRVKETEEKLKSLKAAQDKLTSEGVDKNSEQFRALQREIMKTEADLQGAEGELKNFGSIGAQQIAAVGGVVKEVGGKITAVGDGLTKHVTAPIMAVAGASVASFKEVHDGLEVIITKTGATGDALEEMEGIMKDMASNIPTDFETAASAIGEVNTRFGLTGDALQELATQFVQFADLNNTDVSTSVDKVQKALSAFGMDAEDAGKVLDIFNATGQKTGISVDKISTGLVQNAAAFQEMGLSLEQSVDLMGQLEMSGADSSAVLSGMRKALKNAAKEGVPLNDALADLQQTILNDTTGVDGLTAAYDLFGKSGDVVYNAIKTGSIDFANLGKAVEEAGGSVTDTFNATLTPMDEFQTSMNEVKVLGAEIGAEIMPMLSTALQSVKEVVGQLTEAWRNLSPEAQNAIVQGGLVVAALGPVLSVIGHIVSAIGTIMTVAPQIVAALKAVAAVITGPVAAAIALVVAAIAVWIKNWDAIKQCAIEISKIVKEKWDALCEAITAKMKEAGEFLRKTWDNLKQAVSTAVDSIKTSVSNGFNAVKTAVTNTLNNVKSFINTTLNNIKTAVSTAVDAVKTFFSNGFNAVKTTVSNVLDAVKTTVSSTMDGVKKTVSTAIDAVKTIFSTGFNAVKTVVSSVLSAVKSLISGDMTSAKNSIKTAIDAIKGFFETGFNSVKTVVDTVFSGIFDTIKSKLDAAKKFVEDVISKIKSAFNFDLKLNLKLPKITVQGGEAPWGIGGKGKLPSFHVDWFDKGGIFRNPAIIGVGEKRPEFVGALDDLRTMIREESGGGLNTELLGQMVSLMSEVLAQQKTITVNQVINAQNTSYAAQQREAAYALKRIARAI